MLQQAKEPQIVKKHQTTISNEIEKKILSMYGLGMNYTDISSHIEEIYQVSISTATISAITDKIIDKVKLYMGMKNATKKWNMPMWNWNLTLSQLAIFFEGRLDSEFKI